MDIFSATGLNLDDYIIAPYNDKWFRMLRKRLPPHLFALRDQSKSVLMGLHGTTESGVCGIIRDMRLVPGEASAGWGDIVSCAGYICRKTRDVDDIFSLTSSENVTDMNKLLGDMQASSKMQCRIAVQITPVGVHKTCRNRDSWDSTWGSQPGFIVHHYDHKRSWSVHTMDAVVTGFWIFTG
jgi:hypothetical protein